MENILNSISDLKSDFENLVLESQAEINNKIEEILSPYEMQAKLFANKIGLKYKATWLRYGKHFEGDKDNRHIFRITLSRNGKRFSFNFGQSIASDTKIPTLYDVLACLTKYDVGTFENFCSDYGYNIWEKSSKKVYRNVCKEFIGVERIFGDVLEKLQEIN